MKIIAILLLSFTLAACSKSPVVIDTQKPKTIEQARESLKGSDLKKFDAGLDWFWPDEQTKLDGMTGADLVAWYEENHAAETADLEKEGTKK